MGQYWWLRVPVGTSFEKTSCAVTYAFEQKHKESSWGEIISPRPDVREKGVCAAWIGAELAGAVTANDRQVGDIGDMEQTLEQMARSLTESSDYRLTRRLEPQTEYHPPDNSPKLVAALVDVETTGTNPDRDKIIEFGVCLFEYGRQNGRIYKVLGSWEWFEDPGFLIPPEITNITGIADEMVAGHRIDDRAVDDLLAACRT